MFVELVSENGSYQYWEGALDEFFEANEFDADERRQIAEAIKAGDNYAIGGGAAPLMWLRRDVGCGPSESPGYSHACGYHN